MKAEILIDGKLKIQAETPLEGYALNMWTNANWNPSCSKSITTENIELSWHIENPNAMEDKFKNKMLKIYFEWLATPTGQEMPLDRFIKEYKLK
jgi:hypothetical protein